MNYLQQQQQKQRSEYARARRAFISGASSLVDASDALTLLGFSHEGRNAELIDWHRLRDEQRRSEGKMDNVT